MRRVVAGEGSADFKPLVNGTQLGTPNREPQEYSRNIMEYKDLVGIFLLYTYYILGVPGLGFPVGSLYWFNRGPGY